MTFPVPSPESVRTMQEKALRALKVWRYEIENAGRTDAFSMKMPAGARILCARTGQVNPVIFALVNPEMAEERRYFYQAKTNFPLPSPEEQPERQPGDEELFTWKDMQYVDSYVAFGQVYHLFEVVR